MRRGAIPLVLSGVIAAVMIMPIGVLVYMGVGADVAFTARTAEVVLNTALLAVFSVAASVLIGVPLALVTAYADLPMRRLWTGLLAAPLAIPSYVGAFAYFAAFGPGGEIEALTGLPVPNVYGLPGAALVITLYTYPFVFLTTRAALRNLDAGVVEVARTLGLSQRQALVRVVLPRVKNGVAAGALLVALYAVSDFGTPAIMRFDTFTRMIFVEYNAFGLDRAALLSVYMLGLVGAILWLESRVGAVREAPGRQLRLAMGRGTKAATMGVALVVAAAAIGVPVGLFGAWLVREGAGGFHAGVVINSTYSSLIAAAVAIVIALPVAVAASHGRLGRLLERATYIGFGVPGIVIGTALVVVGLHLGFLYQTLALLVFGYVVRFLPLAVGNARSTLERSGGNLVDAARTLGAGPREVFLRVTLPLCLPGILAGGALVFLEVMRELPMTLLLRPTGFDTLATYLWRVHEAGHFGHGALPAALLVAVSGCAVVAMLRSERRPTDTT
ncbi:ABC transporter permease [Arhodomonas sp. AD133]|uniref:ABC transporter permease n=1 Tax=Arhodomonas sp. AD133 TaxID=3415009 RepID=UPI003EBF17EE